MSNISGPSKISHHKSTSSHHSNRPIQRHSAFDDEDDDEEEDRVDSRIGRGGENKGRWKDEAISGFSSHDERQRKKLQSATENIPLVITKQEDVNWMEERKRRLGLEKYRKEAGLNGNSKDTKDRIGDDKERVGLEIRRSEKDKEVQDVEMNVEQDVGNEEEKVMEKPIDMDDEDAVARAAIISGSTKNENQGENLIIKPISEEEALQFDLDSRPEIPTLSDYSKMPVDSFGAALLRGMGWKEGMGAGKQRQGPISAPLVKKRAALLGLGAKERDSLEDEKKSNNNRSSNIRPERRYVPVSRRESENEKRSEDRSNKSKSSRDRSNSPTSSSRRNRYDEDREERRSRRYEEDRRREERGSEREKYRRDDEKYRERRHRDDRQEKYHSDDRYERDRKSSRR